VDDRLVRDAGDEPAHIEPPVGEVAGRPSNPGDPGLPYDDVVQPFRGVGGGHKGPNPVAKISFPLPGKR
jgi:hypothetical protein